VKPAQKHPSDNAFKQDWCREKLLFQGDAAPHRLANPLIAVGRGAGGIF
jgi:hypothetical protein